MTSMNKLRKRNLGSSINNSNDVYSQYIEDYQFYFDNSLNKTKYADKYNSTIEGDCILLDVSNNNDKNGDEKWITTLPNSNIELLSVISLEFAKDLTQYWVVEDKEYLAIPSHDKFKISPLFYAGVLKRLGIDDIPIDTKVVDNDAIVKEKKIYYSPKVITVERGDYIYYGDSNKTYLVTDVQNFTDLPFADSTECNHILKFMIDGTLYSMQSVVVNNPRFTLGLKTEVAGFTETNDMLRIQIPMNNSTQKIALGQRFLINGEAWRATKVDFTVNKGLTVLLLGTTAINYETDDLILGIADGLTIFPHTYTYNIPTTFEATKGTSVNLVYSIVDEVNKPIDYSGVTVTSGSALVGITNTNGAISISGVDIGTGSMKLSVTVGGVLKEFDIAFEVKTDVVAPVINYTCTWSTGQVSNGVSLKTYMSSTATCKETDNGIVNSTLTANYSLDSIGSTLLSSGAITITRKSNVDFLVKNVSISTSKSFIMTFTNSVDNSIIATQTINLSGM